VKLSFVCAITDAAWDQRASARSGCGWLARPNSLQPPGLREAPPPTATRERGQQRKSVEGYPSADRAKCPDAPRRHAAHLRNKPRAHRLCASYGNGDNSLRAAPSITRACSLRLSQRRSKICGGSINEQSRHCVSSSQNPLNGSLNARHVKAFLSRIPDS
jgi:hypothetical protein